MRNIMVKGTLRLGALTRGPFTTTWDGRRSNGEVGTAGTYRYRFVVTDCAGNQATRPGGSLTLRLKR